MYCNCGDCQAPAVEVAEVSGAPQEVPSLIWGCSIFCGWDYFVACLYSTVVISCVKLSLKIWGTQKGFNHLLYVLQLRRLPGSSCGSGRSFWHGARGPITDLGLLHLPWVFFFVDCLYSTVVISCVKLNLKIWGTQKGFNHLLYVLQLRRLPGSSCGSGRSFWRAARGPITDLGLLHLVCMILHCFSFIKLQLGSEYNSIRWWYSILRLCKYVLCSIPTSYTVL